MGRAMDDVRDAFRNDRWPTDRMLAAAVEELVDLRCEQSWTKGADHTRATILATLREARFDEAANFVEGKVK